MNSGKEKNNRTIHSWQAFLMGLGGIIMAGFFKVIFPSYPEESVIMAIVAVTLGYLGKRTWQKHKSFRTFENTEGE